MINMEIKTTQQINILKYNADDKWIKVDDIIVLKIELKDAFLNVRGNFSSNKIIDDNFEKLE